MHEHFDADWNPTGYTVVTRESAWDDATRRRAEAYALYLRGICPCGCGQPVEKAWDPEQVWSVDHYTCYAARARARVDRDAAKRHEKAPEGWDDGRHSYVIPVDDERPAAKRKPRTRRTSRGD